MKNQKTLTIGWLYPELMNIYGDRGNIITLKKRCEWRKIKAEVMELNVGFSIEKLKKCDILVMGGAQDQQQNIVNKDLQRIKKELAKMIDNGTPGLYVCGGFQFLGKYYKDSDGTIINGLGIFDLYTENPGKDSLRLIGNLIIKPSINLGTNTIVGFENHGGRTHIGAELLPLGEVISGNGNNEDDNTEGAIYKNSFGTYMHGPILPKNPELADYLIQLALKNKYKDSALTPLDNSLEKKARRSVEEKKKL